MRLTSMMAPSLVLRDGRVELVVGSSGSARIRSAIVQVVVAALDLGLPLQEAVELARVHPEGDALDCEGGVPEATLAALEAAGERVVRWPGRNIYFGGAQVVARTADGFRRGGRPAPRRRRHRRRRLSEGGWGADAGLSKKPCD